MWWVLGLWVSLNFPLDPRLPGLAWRQWEHSWTQGQVTRPGLWTRYAFQAQDRPGPTPSLRVIPEILSYSTNSNGLYEVHTSLHFRYQWRLLPFLEVQGQQTLFTLGPLPGYPAYDPLYLPDYRLYTFDPNPIIGKKKIFEVRTDQAFVRFRLSKGFILLGKDRMRLGPGYRGALMLSGFARPLTYLYNAHFQTPHWAFTAFYARLPDTFPRRRFALQRLEFQPWPWLSLGATEGVLFSAPEDPMKYLNPVDLFYVIQRRGRSNDDNLLASIDINWRIRPGIRVYLEFLDDDIIISGENIRNRSLWGYLTGFHLTHGPYEARVEFSWIRKWTYTHYTHRNSVAFWGIPLGHWMGPDARDLYGELSRLSTSGVVAAFFEVLEHGEGRLNLPLEQDPSAATYHKTPSGIVDRRIGGGVYALRYRAFWGFSLGALLRVDVIQNERNHKGQDDLRVMLMFWTMHPGKTTRLEP